MFRRRKNSCSAAPPLFRHLTRSFAGGILRDALQTRVPKETRMIKVKVIGAGGYGGVGMTELLYGHPEAKIAALVDVENVGLPLSKVYPHLTGFCDTVVIDPSDPTPCF